MHLNRYIKGILQNPLSFHNKTQKRLKMNGTYHSTVKAICNKHKPNIILNGRET